MYPDAYAILDKLKLPRPVVYEIGDIKHLDPETPIYVRGQRNIAGINRRSTAGELSKYEQTLSGLYDRRLLTSLEHSPSVYAGGASYISERRWVYSEVCVGHTSGLLLFGYCKARGFTQSGTNVVVRQEFQPTQIQQRRDGSVAVQSTVVPTAFIDHILTSIGRDLIAVGGPMLLEWIWTESNGALYVDAKPYLLRTGFDRLFHCTNGTIALEETANLEEITWCPVYDYPRLCESTIPGGYLVVVENIALLCHFFTYSAHLPRVILYHEQYIVLCIFTD